MLKSGFYILLIVLVFCFPFHAKGQYYNQTIYLPDKGVSKEVTVPVSDMAYWLEKATGKNFEIKNANVIKDGGIYLQFAEQSTLSAALKKRILADGQSFYLGVDDSRTVKIIGSGVNSFSNGIYTFLMELGFRWYMPGDTWTIVPDLNKINLKVNKIYTPDFSNRSYFGTGGMNPVKDLDPENTFANDFNIWNRRNRLSSDYIMKGHTGEDFYITNQNVLKEHPEYFCNNKINRAGRIDISNPAVVDLYIQWALKQVNSNNRFSVIGVDPADGSGGNDDCLPANMPEIKSWSDKYFWLANKVALQAEKKGIKAITELYAYSSHAAPPSFQLHKNIYPVVIPYAFQTLTTPKLYIKLWQEKMQGRPMGIYDYWNITQWSSDIPQFNIYTIPQKLQLWQQSNINTINLESTNAKGPMGHAFWLATQFMWNSHLSFDSLYKDFLKQCFGPAAPDIKNMYDRWSLHYQGAMDVSLSLKDLASASSKTSDKAIQDRLYELKAYVHYLKLYYDYQSNHSIGAYQDLIQYIYGIHHMRLLQTSALAAYYIKVPSGFTQLAGAKVSALDNKEIEKRFRNDLQENPVTYEVSNFFFDITKAYPIENRDLKIRNPLYISGTINYIFYVTQKRWVTIQAGATANTKLTIKDDKEKILYEKVITRSTDGFDTININVPKGKYIISFGTYSRFCRIVFPKDIAFFSSDYLYDNYNYPLLYVYVPKGTSEIIYNDNLGPGINGRGNWIDPGGHVIKPQIIKYTAYRIPVPLQYRGKVWTLNMGHAGFRLLNIPNVFSLNNFKYEE